MNIINYENYIVKDLKDLSNEEIKYIVDNYHTQEFMSYRAAFHNHDNYLKIVNSTPNREYNNGCVLVSFDLYLNDDLQGVSFKNVSVDRIQNLRIGNCNYGNISNVVLQDFLSTFLDKKYFKICKKMLKILENDKLSIDDFTKSLVITYEYVNNNSYSKTAIPTYITSGIEFDIEIKCDTSYFTLNEQNIIFKTISNMIFNKNNVVYRIAYLELNRIYVDSLPNFNKCIEEMYINYLNQYDNLKIRDTDEMYYYKEFLKNKGPFLFKDGIYKHI